MINSTVNMDSDGSGGNSSFIKGSPVFKDNPPVSMPERRNEESLAGLKWDYILAKHKRDP
jgi:phosphatidylinositol kinase/protein kinase (PI-3  family)